MNVRIARVRGFAIMRLKKGVVIVLSATLLSSVGMNESLVSFSLLPNSTVVVEAAAEQTSLSVPAKTTASSLNVRKSAGDKGAKLVISGKNVTLKKNTSIKIHDEKIVKGSKWYYVSFTYKSKKRYGWISGNYVKLNYSSPIQANILPTKVTVKKTAGSSKVLTKSGKKVTLKKGTQVTLKGEVKKKSDRFYKISVKYSGKTLTGYVKATEVKFKKKELSEEAKFEAYLKEQGFPDSYKAALRNLHEKYPSWKFEAFHTGLDWNTVIKNETVLNRSTVETTKPNWISKDPNAFDYVNDKPYPVDGTTWFNASKEVVSYYMDPRNFLDEVRIFQFENQEYLENVQTLAAVKAMLKGTPLEGSYSYVNDKGKTVKTTYAETFMAAAKKSKVSPYVLVARVKNEILCWKNGKLSFSDSVTGTVPNYIGFYNFYNIGAVDSPGGGAIEKGLNYAKNGSWDKDRNARILIPWDNRYKSIVGGAIYIGEGYIAKGQNTSYLMRFNVTKTNTYQHQYMTNTEAPYGEAKSVYDGYKSQNDLSSTKVFRIPVYKNMPSKPAAHPDQVSSSAKLSFNNWLKDLEIYWNGKELIYNFQPANEKQSFNVASNVQEITIKPIAANSGAKVSVKASGASFVSNQTYQLVSGENKFSISVTAANGSVKNYVITIIKK